MTDADDKDIGNELRCILEAYPALEVRNYAEADRSELADAIIDLRVKLETEAEKKAAAATAHLRALRGER